MGNTMIFIFFTIFIVSLIAAVVSLKDVGVPKEILKLITARKIKGSIVFFGKRQVKHYSSSSKSSR